MGKRLKGILLFCVVVAIIALAVSFFSGNKMISNSSITIQEFQQQMKDKNIAGIEIYPYKETPTGRVDITLKNPAQMQYMYTDNTQNIVDEAIKNNILCKINPVKNDDIIKTLVVPAIVMVAFAAILFGLLNRQGNAAGKAMDYTKSKARRVNSDDNAITFKDVAGCDEEKEELEEVVEFLKSPAKFTSLGARIPKGILLVGPPGTGKTLLAKAVAGEARVPFFSISGSDFVEVFVGVGAARVRDLFAEAKKNAPCIVFIDEIDAVARKRGAGLGGSHDEREQTLNQMLVEMDGFQENSGIIVLAATNRVDILDPAILRPGRFDRKVGVGRPDVKGREEILKIHARKKKLSDDVNLNHIARTTAGMTGADLENMLNEAAILAAKNNKSFISRSDLERSFIKVGIGTEKRSRIISDKEKNITAYHEAGHAILFHLLPDVGPVHTISIIPTGVGAAGYTMPLPDNDNMFNTYSSMIQEIIVDLGGRVAEEIIFGDVTTGASQDIKNATSMAKAMVTKYGMANNIGLIDYSDDDNEVFIGRDFGHTKSYSDKTATEIDEAVKNIIEMCHKQAREYLNKYKHVLEACARALLDKEKLTREEFEQLFAEEELPVIKSFKIEDDKLVIS